MYIKYFRIFVLPRKRIEEIINSCIKDNNSLYIETRFFTTGAFVRVLSEDIHEIDYFEVQIEEKIGFFLIEGENVSDPDISSADISGNILRNNKKRIVTAESCTGGLIAKKLTDSAGSSDYFWGSFVTYDNGAKVALGVDLGTLEKHGAVSSETVLEMAVSALSESDADISVSVSGVAGPGGGSSSKPVGTVWFAVSYAGNTESVKMLFSGSREEVREKASEAALLIVIKRLLNIEGVDSINSGDYI
jgi:nicotinamide-nucleotide amidase